MASSQSKIWVGSHRVVQCRDRRKRTKRVTNSLTSQIYIYLLIINQYIFYVPDVIRFVLDQATIGEPTFVS